MFHNILIFSNGTNTKPMFIKFVKVCINESLSKITFTCSKSTIKTLEKDVK